MESHDICPSQWADFCQSYYCYPSTAMSYVIGAFISTNVIWYVIFFSTLDVKTQAAEIAQYFATWIWQVGLIPLLEFKREKIAHLTYMSCNGKILFGRTPALVVPVYLHSWIFSVIFQ